MNEYQKGVFEYRKSILGNAEDIIAYSKAFHKKSPVNQLSLFAPDVIEVKRPDILKDKLSQYELLELADKEVSAIGLPILYDAFDDYILLDKTLCSHSLLDASFCTTDNAELTFLARLQGSEIRKSKWGNEYGLIILERDGVTIKSYLRGGDWKNQYRRLIKGGLYIVKCLYNNEFYSVNRMSDCGVMDTNDYIDSINLTIPKKSVSAVTAYLFNKAVLRGNTAINYIVDGKVFESIYMGLFSSEICLDLMDIGCEISINRVK